MKRFASILLASVMLFAIAGTAMGNIGWAGNIWPVNGTPYTTNDNIDVYVQVWKDGCTGPDGPCADLSAVLYYRCTGGPAFTAMAMPYFGINGGNDEFNATIPNTHGCTEVELSRSSTPRTARRCIPRTRTATTRTSSCRSPR